LIAVLVISASGKQNQCLFAGRAIVAGFLFRVLVLNMKIHVAIRPVIAACTAPEQIDRDRSVGGPFSEYVHQLIQA
jgi:hypothetical protein